MAGHHVIHCAHCGEVVKPTGRNGRYRKTQRFCGPKCARASQVIVPTPAAERLWKHVRKTETCWLWEGAKSGNGYGHINCGRGVYRPAHVVSYEAVNGPVPDGCELDHTCRVPLCVNPAHLEAVTHRENVIRGVAPTSLIHKTGRCARGHEVTEANVYYRKDRPGRWNCRACRNERRAKSRADRGRVHAHGH